MKTFTQEEIDNRTSDFICWDCGLQFLQAEQKKRHGIATTHQSTCGLCGTDKPVTHYRNWNYLHIK